ncbi:hypothetical protein O181_052073 [Austropuccinia psidii MF-1]|uniref:Reverse transcriptase/retrotransposon-derived protein RNase H-like domain-containing protein n=1 Tax=Austropuccinia psidii MF-1 TaxID=1389203 RepID=A0A9Q3E1Z4_9BASI|nr:hypothetical protein [Austropuccinia psidii MF-1]
MFPYKLLILEVWFQEFEIGMKELSSIISGRDCHPVFWINWPPILQDLMDITLELDTRYHERQKKKINHQEKKPEASKSNYSHPQNSSSLNQKKKKNFQKGDKLHFSFLNKDFKLIDLPPSSYHDSVEEFWDEKEEPEEIETVMKVVPSAYHQYLDVFLKKDTHFPLNEEALRQFHKLKEDFITSPVLPQFHPSLPTIVETDASYYALGAVLSLVSGSGKHPIAFDSFKLLPANLNHEIHDKELLGRVWALKRWRAFLLSLSSPFEVLTNDSSLKYFMSSKILTCYEACWDELLSEFHFEITNRPNLLENLPDALSHWDKVYQERGVSSARIQ